MNITPLSLIYSNWDLRIKSAISTLGLAISFLATSVLLMSLVSSLHENGITFPFIVFCLIFLLGFRSPERGIVAYIFLLPLLPGLPYQWSQFTGVLIPSVDAVGFELTIGLVLSLSLRGLWQKYAAKSQHYVVPNLPWQLSFILIFITGSCCLSIIRNVWQSGVYASAYGVFFNLIHFRSLGWHEDFRPMFDWLSYGMAGAIGAFLIPMLREHKDSNAFVFRPILFALFISSVWAFVQSSSGVGGGIGFRRDFFGIPAFGFQPDLHAFAGYLLLGLIGLFGFLKFTQAAVERYLILAVIGFTLFALILSKSRSTLLIGLITLVTLLLINLWLRNRKYFYWAVAIFLFLITCIGFAWYELAIFYRSDLNGFMNSFWGRMAKSSWVVQLALELSDRELSHFNELSIALGGRPEFYRAALRMLYFFPMLGVGLGGFYRESIFEQFTASPTLRSLGGENTHNYFLQTLAETGLIGGLIFSIAIIYPMYLAVRQRQSWPAFFGLLGLFLGNIYAHSFLVRENFLLATVLLSLLYATISFNSEFTLSHSKTVHSKFYLKIIFASILFIFCVREVLQSFYRYPFKYGELCFVQKDLSSDGWTSGLFKKSIPRSSTNLYLEFDPLRANISIVPLEIELQVIQDGVGILASQKVKMQHNGLERVNLSFVPQPVPLGGEVSIEIRLSSCFTPKNLGVNIDSRRLGLMVSQLKVF